MSQQQQTEQERLDFEKEQARIREELAKATRTDAFGNRITYSDAGGFETILAPLIESIVGAETDERYRSVSEDAKRNRDARIRADEQSKTGDAMLTDALASFGSERRPSEQEMQGDAVRQALLSFSKPDVALGSVARDAIRTGNTAALSAYGAASKSNKPKDISAGIAEAKNFGTQRYLTENAARDQQERGEIDWLRALSSGAPQAGLMFGNDAQTATARQDNALSMLANILLQNSNSIGSAYSSLANSQGQAPDVSSIFASLGDLLGGITFSNPAEDKAASKAAIKENTI